MRVKLGFLGVILPVVLLVDRVTKIWAETALLGNPQELLGGLLPLTLAYNKGAAFGMSIGDDSRWFFIPVTFLALGLLAVLYKQADRDDPVRLTALSLVMAGALGNLYDRIFIRDGVVDFLGPVDLGFWHFPIFNVADISITCGAILLAISFWQEEKQIAAAKRAREAPGPGRDQPSADPETASPSTPPDYTS